MDHNAEVFRRHNTYGFLRAYRIFLKQTMDEKRFASLYYVGLRRRNHILLLDFINELAD